MKRSLVSPYFTLTSRILFHVDLIGLFNVSKTGKKPRFSKLVLVLIYSVILQMMRTRIILKKRRKNTVEVKRGTVTKKKTTAIKKRKIVIKKKAEEVVMMKKMALKVVTTATKGRVRVTMRRVDKRKIGGAEVATKVKYEILAVTYL